VAFLGITPAIVQAIGTAAAVAGAGVSVYSAVEANQNAAEAKDAARRKAEIERLQTNSEARQQRSVVNRRMAQQVDASRVLSAAAGVSGGASQMVLESAYARDASADLATLSANQFYRNTGIGISLTNNLNRIDSQTPSVGVAAVQGVLQGIGTYMTVTDGLNRMRARTETGDPAPNNPDTIGGSSQSSSIYAAATP